MQMPLFFRLIPFLLLLSLLLTPRAKAQEIDTFYDAVDDFMGIYVADGLVAYASIKEEPAALNALLQKIAGFDRSDLDANAEKAFLINAYNVLVIKNVIDHYPMNSPLEVNGFFDRSKFIVAGENKTLDDLEKRDLYVKYPDARLHFVLVCAALGCPELIEKAYRHTALEDQLNSQTNTALNNPVHVNLTSSGDEVQVSELFSWYKNDFDRDADSVIGFINRYRDEKLPAEIKIGYITYNWQLNDLINSDLKNSDLKKKS